MSGALTLNDMIAKLFSCENYLLTKGVF